VGSIWGVTPRQSVERECARAGTSAVVATCVAILSECECDEGFLFVIGGPGARNVVDGREGGKTGYWPKTWAARALLYAWDDHATSAVVMSTRAPSSACALRQSEHDAASPRMRDSSVAQLVT
jgi:hypothetical protein